MKVLLDRAQMFGRLPTKESLQEGVDHKVDLGKVRQSWGLDYYNSLANPYEQDIVQRGQVVARSHARLLGPGAGAHHVTVHVGAGSLAPRLHGRPPLLLVAQEANLVGGAVG